MLLYRLITIDSNAKDIRETLRAHLMKLSRKQFIDAAAKLSVTARDNSDLVALLSHFDMKELPPPKIPIRLPEFEKYELTPERASIIADLSGK